MTARDWDLRGVRLAGFQFAEWLAMNGRPENFIDEYQTDPERAWAAAEASGWVETVEPTTGPHRRLGQRPPEPQPRLTGNGHLEVERVRRTRDNPHARASACREAILLWLAHEGRGAGSAELMASRDNWRFYDSPFTADEVNEASRFLRETGLVEGWDYPGGTFMQPKLTAKGTQCVEFFDANVRDFLYPPQNGGGSVTNQQNFYGDVNGQVGQGQNVTQTQNNGMDAEALSVVFKAMREALSTIDDLDDRADVEHGIQQLEAAVKSGDADAVTASAGRLQRLAARVGTAASNTAITAVTTEGVKQVLGALGLG